jgi:hypothetical protein
MPALIGYLVALGFWQLPGVVDALRVTPALVAAEVGTFAIIGVAYWSEIVTISPLAPRTSGPGLVALAVLPMWTVWVIAYFIGFSHNGWFPAYGHAGAMISAVADEQFATGTLWALSAATFLPVVFANLLRVLSNDVDESGGSHVLGGPARQARG